MNLKEMIERVHNYTNDTTGTLFPSSIIKGFVNEGIDRLKQIKELEGVKYLSSDSDEPILIPKQYHYILSVYGASRCFSQDEQHYQAQTYMDEFSSLMSLLELGIKEGNIIITDESGSTVTGVNDFDSVRDVYFTKVVVNNG